MKRNRVGEEGDGLPKLLLGLALEFALEQGLDLELGLGEF